MESNAGKHGMKSAAKREPHEPQVHHAHMAADFRKRFWISLVITLPILVLSPDIYVLFGLSSAVFWYGGRPFLKKGT
jgi:Cu2+-exporting ATPase